MQQLFTLQPLPQADARRNVPHASGARTASHAPPGGERWSSDQLLAGRNEICITHGDSIYRLRLTSLGKLILTK